MKYILFFSKQIFIIIFLFNLYGLGFANDLNDFELNESLDLYKQFYKTDYLENVFSDEIIYFFNEELRGVINSEERGVIDNLLQIIYFVRSDICNLLLSGNKILLNETSINFVVRVEQLSQLQKNNSAIENFVYDRFFLYFDARDDEELKRKTSELIGNLNSKFLNMTEGNNIAELNQKQEEERLERERLAKEEEEKRQREAELERQRKAELARQERERLERERLAQEEEAKRQKELEKKRKAELARQEKERLERERLAQEEEAKRQKELEKKRKAELARQEKERLERERLAKEEEERKKREAQLSPEEIFDRDFEKKFLEWWEIEAPLINNEKYKSYLYVPKSEMEKCIISAKDWAELLSSQSPKIQEKYVKWIYVDIAKTKRKADFPFSCGYKSLKVKNKKLLSIFQRNLRFVK